MKKRIRAVIAYNGADAGLGNRVRVTLGAARYARYVNAPFLYVWPTTSHFEPRMGELWEWRHGTSIPRSTSRTLGLFTGYTGNDLTSPQCRTILQIRTGGELQLPEAAGDWRADLRHLRPVPEVAEAVNSIHVSEFGDSPYVGIQIRAHAVSHQRTKATSPVSWFVDKMRHTLSERPDSRFYISCDVPELKHELLRAFPSATANLTSARYNSREAVRAAIVDLYLLSSSSYMIGPTGSSFIELAQFLSNMRVPTDKPEQTSQYNYNWVDLSAAPDPLVPSVRN
jgi:hypothetical protein